MGVGDHQLTQLKRRHLGEAIGVLGAFLLSCVAKITENCRQLTLNPSVSGG